MIFSSIPTVINKNLKNLFVIFIVYLKIYLKKLNPFNQLKGVGAGMGIHLFSEDFLSFGQNWKKCFFRYI